MRPGEDGFFHRFRVPDDERDEVLREIEDHRAAASAQTAVKSAGYGP